MNDQHLTKLSSKSYPKLIAFIYDLLIDKNLNRIIPLSHIDVNDWECNLKPSVYVHGKHNMFKTRRYSRCSKRDTKYAVKFFENN